MKVAKQIRDTAIILVALLFCGFVAYGVKTDCEDTAGIYVKCENE